MGDLTELLDVNSEQTLNFFWEHLKNEAPLKKVTDAEILYVANVLSHYAQTSRGEIGYTVPSGSLYEVLDKFVIPGFYTNESSIMKNPEIMEIAGSHTLLLVGFFRDQMNRKHNLTWYEGLGRMFFKRASEGVRMSELSKRNLLSRVAHNFPIWVTTCQNASKTMRENRYLLRL